MRIKSSKRGLTFSFQGPQHKPLVDLRNKEIKDLLAIASYMEIQIQDDKIVVNIISKDIYCQSTSDRELVELLDKQDKVTLEIPKEKLLEKDDLLMDIRTHFMPISIKKQNFLLQLKEENSQ